MSSGGAIETKTLFIDPFWPLVHRLWLHEGEIDKDRLMSAVPEKWMVLFVEDVIMVAVGVRTTPTFLFSFSSILTKGGVLLDNHDDIFEFLS